MKYLSICSGIEAATVAWHSLNWEPVGFAEIEPFPAAVLAHHYPDVPNFGDMTTYEQWDIKRGDIGILVGGTPCQSFSVAGLRKGLDDDRGNLSLVFCQLANYIDPEFVVWENVPGVLSDKTNAFGCLLAGLAGEVEALEPPGGKWKNAGYVLGPKRSIAWRVLDAQYFGVAQRRRRVFVVASAGGICASEVLFEREGVRRDTAPSRESREDVTGSTAQCFEPRSPDGHARLIGDFSPTLNRMGGGQREPCVITGICASDQSDLAPTVTSKWSKLSGGPAGSISELGISVMVAQPCHAPEPMWTVPRTTSALDVEVADNYFKYVMDSLPQVMAVRRLTPVECERLQGFPDGYTDIKPKGKDTPDGPRYKALGNSMAVPVMRWIGERIDAIKGVA